MRIFRQMIPCIVTAAVFFVGSAAWAQSKDPKEPEAIAAIRKLGGKAELDEERPSHPAIKVDLRRTKVTDEELAPLKHLRHLQILYLNQTEIGDEGLVHLTGLTDLHTLSIYGTKVTDKGMATVKVMTRLKVLIVCGDAITDKGLEELESMTNLQELYIYATQVTAEGANKLRKCLPKCYVAGR
jgi:Leucine Rich repeat